MDEVSKKLDDLIAEVKELNQDLTNIIVLGYDVKSLDAHVKKFLDEK